MGIPRLVRVNELLKREISTILERRIVPLVSALITVTGVDTAPDLRQAIVFVSVYGGDADEVLQLLRKQRGEIQREMWSNRRLCFDHSNYSLACAIHIPGAGRTSFHLYP